MSRAVSPDRGERKWTWGLLVALSLLAAPAQAQWLDPDRRWNEDQWVHAAAGAALDVVIRAPFVTSTWRDTPAKRIAGVIALSVLFELYQVYEHRQAGWLGNEGAGFGLLDLAADVLGALAVEGLDVVFRR